MRIALVTPVFPPYAAGMALVAASHARILAEAGHEVTVLAPLGKDGLRMSPQYRIQSLPSRFRYGNAAYVPALRSYLRTGAYDRIALEYPFLGGAEVFLFKDIPAAPLRLYYHMDLVGAGATRSVFDLYNRLCLSRMVRKFPKIAVSSLDYARTGLLRDAVASAPQKFTEIPVGISVLSSRSERSGVEGYCHTKFLFVAALDRAHYFKGLPVLLRALASPSLGVAASPSLGVAASPSLGVATTPSAGRAPWTLTIVGDGDLRPRYERLAASLGIADRVQFAGLVKSDELVGYYERADALVLPSIDRSEAFGIVLLEAMAAGRAVIASNLPGVRTLVRENGFLVRPGDVDDLAAKIKDMVNDPERLVRMGARGRAMVEERYLWEKVSAQFVSWICS